MQRRMHSALVLTMLIFMAASMQLASKEPVKVLFIASSSLFA